MQNTGSSAALIKKMESNHEYYMARALRLAEQGLCTTHPNPRVGCVLVRDNEIVGEGWHRAAGEPHAEIHALRAAGERARGATAYVTLEPCCHHGRTPPCSHALIEAGVAKVVAAQEDPNPQVAGQGLRQLAAAGIETASGVLQHQAEQLNRGFVQRMRTGRPWLRVKLAMSLDGRTAMADGTSQWITGSDARRDVQALRAASSAIMTGSGTVLADDPALTVRPDELPAWLPYHGEMRQPHRIIIDKYLSTPPHAKILQQPGSTLIFTCCGDDPEAQACLQEQGAEVVAMSGPQDRVDLRELSLELGRREYNEVHVECGAVLAGALLHAGLIDELVLYAAPLLMGDGARGLFHLPGLERMEQRIHLEVEDIRAVGRDWRIRARITNRESSDEGTR